MENEKKLPVKIKLLRPEAQLPKYQSVSAAAADLYAALKTPMTIEPGAIVRIPTGIAIDCGRDDLAIVLCARSGLAAKGITLANGIGLVDADYRGEILVLTANISDQPYTVAPGERIAQMMFVPVCRASFETTDTLTETARGAGGFGSTGTK